MVECPNINFPTEDVLKILFYRNLLLLTYHNEYEINIIYGFPVEYSMKSFNRSLYILREANFFMTRHSSVFCPISVLWVTSSGINCCYLWMFLLIGALFSLFIAASFSSLSGVHQPSERLSSAPAVNRFSSCVFSSFQLRNDWLNCNIFSAVPLIDCAVLLQYDRLHFRFLVSNELSNVPKFSAVKKIKNDYF